MPPAASRAVFWMPGPIPPQTLQVPGTQIDLRQCSCEVWAPWHWPGLGWVTAKVQEVSRPGWPGQAVGCAGPARPASHTQRRPFWGAGGSNPHWGMLRWRGGCAGMPIQDMHFSRCWWLHVCHAAEQHEAPQAAGGMPALTTPGRQAGTGRWASPAPPSQAWGYLILPTVVCACLCRRVFLGGGRGHLVGSSLLTMLEMPREPCDCCASCRPIPFPLSQKISSTGTVAVR